MVQAMSVVLAHAAYLPTAQCFALLPLVGGFSRTGSTSGAVLDYDLERQAVTVVAQRPYRCECARATALRCAGTHETRPYHASLICSRAAPARVQNCSVTLALLSAAAKGRRCCCMMAGPMASCCWLQAPSKPATLQVGLGTFPLLPR